MKKFRLLLITSLISFFALTSCEDAYNIVQDGELNEEDFTTLGQMESYLNTVYATVSIGNEIGFTGVFTDETGVGRGSGGQNFTTHRFIINTADPYAGAIWYGHYTTINRVNRLLRIANQVPVPTDPSELARYKSAIAQGRALRAFSYFQLLTYFSTDLKNDSALGVMLITNVPQASEDFPRATNGEVFAQIESDLQYAYDNVTPAATSPYKYVSQNMINALRARMYLYRGNYTLAKQYAQDVITNAGVSLTLATPVPSPAPTNPNYTVFVASNPLTVGAPTAAWNTSFYGAATTNPYRRMFSDATTGGQGEVIFALDRPAAGAWENIAGQFTTNTTTISGSPLWEVGRTLFNKLRATPGDVRRYANVDPTSLINQNYATDVNYLDTDVLVIDKYPGKPSFPLRNDVKVFRLSEMYFILAECLANEGNINGASNSVASVIKQIRDARNFLGAQPLPVYASTTEALTDILHERHLELCFEGHRYIDIKRLGPLTGKSIERDPTDDIISGATLTIPNNDYRFTLPIPQDELNANDLIRGQQNPGY
ncbi:MAG: RagB/SusD family nutrient uptake outer membrane protein [Flavobacterium sp.]|nr:RagB/SusD family nutrient uptake outer membrane protein [Flavobacterium sp.]